MAGLIHSVLTYTDIQIDNPCSSLFRRFTGIRIASLSSDDFSTVRVPQIQTGKARFKANNLKF